MSKIYLDHLFGYNKKDVYLLAHNLGRRLTDFLGKELFLLLLDSNVLMNSFKVKKLQCISDDTYKLHSSAKAFEGFLNKVIKGKDLKENKDDKIGHVFGKGDSKTRAKIKDKKIIAKTKAVWDFCRNDIMHYSSGNLHSSSDIRKKYGEIEEVIILIYKDFYGKTEPDEEIEKGFKRYFRT